MIFQAKLMCLILILLSFLYLITFNGVKINILIFLTMQNSIIKIAGLANYVSFKFLEEEI
jgi:hypothetical protein